MAALVCGTSFVSVAGTTKTASTKKVTDGYAIHYTMCGQDTYAVGANRAEALEICAVLSEAYC